MALEETTTLESVELVGEFNIIQAKWDTVVKKDGVVIAKNNHRRTFTPGQNVEGQDQKIIDVAAKFHTDAVKSAWSTHVSNSGPTSS